MASVKKNRDKKTGNGVNLGFEAKLWEAVDKMRGHVRFGYCNARPDPLLCASLLFQGGFVEFKPMYISPLSIPKQPMDEGISSLVAKISIAKYTNPTADVSALEADIDRLVYSLYGLTSDEIALIEAATSTSKG